MAGFPLHIYAAAEDTTAVRLISKADYSYSSRGYNRSTADIQSLLLMPYQRIQQNYGRYPKLIINALAEDTIAVRLTSKADYSCSSRGYNSSTAGIQSRLFML